SGVYRLFGTPFGIKITPLVIQYIILSNKWGAVHHQDFSFLCFLMKMPQKQRFSVSSIFLVRLKFCGIN
ncbi:MAG: hypothetical protein KHY85_11135, partial [Clostridium sp.]|nr:hypothetical protein [Clostridium sp.]